MMGSWLEEPVEVGSTTVLDWQDMVVDGADSIEFAPSEIVAEQCPFSRPLFPFGNCPACLVKETISLKNCYWNYHFS